MNVIPFPISPADAPEEKSEMEAPNFTVSNRVEKVLGNKEAWKNKWFRLNLKPSDLRFSSEVRAYGVDLSVELWKRLQYGRYASVSENPKDRTSEQNDGRFIHRGRGYKWEIHSLPNEIGTESKILFIDFA